MGAGRHGRLSTHVGPDGHLVVVRTSPQVTFNRGRTLMDLVEEQIYDNLSDYADDGYDYYDGD